MAIEGTSNHAGILSVRPDSGVYATYQRLSYKAWNAIAEFADNSTQNYFDHRERLLEEPLNSVDTSRLQIEISYDVEEDVLTIHDNANGMEWDELQRAVALNRPPPNRGGRCEFGMGLKTAACWFGRRWSIRTSQLGSDRELYVAVHVPQLAESKIETLSVSEREVGRNEHYTEIKIQELYKPLKGRTVGRIREQLGSLYRHDIRTEEIEIQWNGAPVYYEEPNFLREEFEDGTSVEWKKEIKFQIPAEGSNEMLTVAGWVGILNPGSQKNAGFALLRRGRVIIGGPGEGFKPVEIFGYGNSYRSQRLIGELNMDNWPVTQAKDDFDWSGDLEEAFITELKLACQDYMEKAEGYREREKPITKAEMEQVSEPIRNIFTKEKFESALEQEIKFPSRPKTVEEESKDSEKLSSVSNGPVQYVLRVGEGSWTFRIHWQDQLTDAAWMEVNYPQENLIDIFLNMSNTFFSGLLDDGRYLELLQKFVMALALAEKIARTTSRNEKIDPGDIRMRMNTVLRRAADLERKDDS